MAKMHHFMIEADKETGEWLMDTIRYLGEIEAAEHYAKKDTAEFHYDQHDGEVLDPKFWDVAEVEPVTSNVALTIKHVE